MKTTTFDQSAIAILLANGPSRARDLALLARQAKQSVGAACPFCSSTRCESNVDGSTFLCAECDEQWDASEYRA